MFDTDIKPEKNIQIEAAIKLAKDNNVISIVSAPCIELWFLLHYEYTTAMISSNDVIERLRKHYPKYEKNCNIYSEIKDRMDIAIENSKKLEHYQKQNSKKLQTVEANPYTEMYKMVEELKKFS